MKNYEIFQEIWILVKGILCDMFKGNVDLKEEEEENAEEKTNPEVIWYL